MTSRLAPRLSDGAPGENVEASGHNHRRVWPDAAQATLSGHHAFRCIFNNRLESTGID